MNAPLPTLQVRLYAPDGGIRIFDQPGSDVAARVHATLNPAKLFAADTLKIRVEDTEHTFAPSELTRVDLVTDQLSVWDFPFVLGAHMELTGAEFREFITPGPAWESSGWPVDLPVLMKFAMNNGGHYFFRLEVAGGLSAMRMSRIDSMLKRGHLIFGLRAGGIGILNLANATHFSVYPEPPDASGDAQTIGYKVGTDEFGLPEFRLSPPAAHESELIDADRIGAT